VRDVVLPEDAERVADGGVRVGRHEVGADGVGDRHRIQKLLDRVENPVDGDDATQLFVLEDREEMRVAVEHQLCDRPDIFVGRESWDVPDKRVEWLVWPVACRGEFSSRDDPLELVAGDDDTPDGRVVERADEFRDARLGCKLHVVVRNDVRNVHDCGSAVAGPVSCRATLPTSAFFCRFG
jgi:hypothetical protein